MTSDPLPLRSRDLRESGMPLVDEDVALEPWGRERRHQQHQRSLFVVPTVTESPTGLFIVRVPACQISSYHFLDAGIRQLDARVHERARDSDAVQLGRLLQQRRGVVLGSVNDVPSPGIPARIVARGGTGSVE